MISLLHSSFYTFKRKLSTIFLAFSFFLGFFFGILSFIQSGESFSSLMLGSIFSAVSIVDFLTCALLPFLLSSIVVSLRLTGLLHWICFLEAFLYAYVSMFVFSIFPVPDLFYRWIFLFGDAFSLPLLFFYCIRKLTKGTSYTSRWTFLLWSTVIFIHAVEYCFILSSGLLLNLQKG